MLQPELQRSYCNCQTEIISRNRCPDSHQKKPKFGVWMHAYYFLHPPHVENKWTTGQWTQHCSLKRTPIALSTGSDSIDSPVWIDSSQSRGYYYFVWQGRLLSTTTLPRVSFAGNDDHADRRRFADLVQVTRTLLFGTKVGLGLQTCKKRKNQHKWIFGRKMTFVLATLQMIRLGVQIVPSQS